MGNKRDKRSGGARILFFMAACAGWQDDRKDGGLGRISQCRRQISGGFDFPLRADGGSKTATDSAQADSFLYPYQACIMSMPS